LFGNQLNTLNRVQFPLGLRGLGYVLVYKLQQG
jgi:hypothetical protein